MLRRNTAAQEGLAIGRFVLGATPRLGHAPRQTGDKAARPGAKGNGNARKEWPMSQDYAWPSSSQLEFEARRMHATPGAGGLGDLAPALVLRGLPQVFDFFA